MWVDWLVWKKKVVRVRSTFMLFNSKKKGRKIRGRKKGYFLGLVSLFHSMKGQK